VNHAWTKNGNHWTRRYPIPETLTRAFEELEPIERKVERCLAIARSVCPFTVDAESPVALRHVAQVLDAYVARARAVAVRTAEVDEHLDNLEGASSWLQDAACCYAVRQGHCVAHDVADIARDGDAVVAAMHGRGVL